MSNEHTTESTFANTPPRQTLILDDEIVCTLGLPADGQRQKRRARLPSRPTRPTNQPAIKKAVKNKTVAIYTIDRPTKPPVGPNKPKVRYVKRAPVVKQGAGSRSATQATKQPVADEAPKRGFNMPAINNPEGSQCTIKAPPQEGIYRQQTSQYHIAEPSENVDIDEAELEAQLIAAFQADEESEESEEE